MRGEAFKLASKSSATLANAELLGSDAPNQRVGSEPRLGDGEMFLLAPKHRHSRLPFTTHSPSYRKRLNKLLSRVELSTSFLSTSIACLPTFTQTLTMPETTAVAGQTSMSPTSYARGQCDALPLNTNRHQWRLGGTLPRACFRHPGCSPYLAQSSKTFRVLGWSSGITSTLVR